LALLPDGEKVLLKFNQAFCDPDPLQLEALFQPHQLRAHGVIVDDCAKRHLHADGEQGGQCLITPEQKMEMHFDGWKTYFLIRKPSATDMQKYPIVEMTSPLPYEPQRCRYSLRAPKSAVEDMKEWCARLGFPTYEVAEATLKHTTQMVQTLQAETREYLRDHHKTCVWALRPQRINDVCYSDTFFSAVVSICGFKCFQMFAFKYSMMRRESQASEATTPEIPTASPFAPPSVPMVSQTQPEVKDVDSDDEDDSDPIAGRYSKADFDSMASDVNNVFDRDNQCDREELDSIIEHRFLAGVLELKVSYTTGSIKWHPIELVKDVDAQAVANYILINDLGPISNGQHRHWAGAFLRSLRRKLRRLRRSSVLGFEATTFILIQRSAGHVVQLKQSKRRTERRIRPQRAKVSVLSNTGSKCPRIGRTSYALTQPLVTGNGKMPLRKR